MGIGACIRLSMDLVPVHDQAEIGSIAQEVVERAAAAKASNSSPGQSLWATR